MVLPVGATQTFTWDGFSPNTVGYPGYLDTSPTNRTQNDDGSFDPPFLATCTVAFNGPYDIELRPGASAPSRSAAKTC